MPTRTLLVFFLLFLTCRAVANPSDMLADTKPRLLVHQFSVGYGRASYTRLLEGYVGGTRGYRETPVTKYTGTFNASYHLFFRERIALGLAFAMENESGDWHKAGYYTGSSIYSPTMGVFKRNVYSVVLELKVNYSKRLNSPVTAYGYFGIGYTYLNEIGIYSPEYYNSQYVNGVNSLGGSLEVSRDHDKTGFQICPIGISFGRKYGGFAELGFGYKGIYNFGFRLTL